ncbi:MAG: M20/M25/M40 family metallo-hydrolase [Candidatus Eisenbacteria bacterium]|nr:M20/M25/M40 family metallo-hydrolase [Candidatus Eisenbacteria bacterium]
MFRTVHLPLLLTTLILSLVVVGAAPAAPASGERAPFANAATSSLFAEGLADSAYQPPAEEPLAFATGDAAPAAARMPGFQGRTHPSTDVLRAIPPESLIAALVESTSLANVTATVERLQAFGTRYVSTDSCDAAGLWIRDRFLEYGFSDVRLDTFRTWTWQDSVDAFNVLAYKPGSVSPSEHVILGGHYDSVTTQNFDDPNAPAPGAEDNATGVAAVLEAARVLSDVGTERSIIFACWSAEEEGLWGSRAFVADAVEESTDVVLYLNMDAIGYLAPPVPDGFMMADTCALAVAGWMCDVALEHTGYEFDPVVQPLGASDHNSFWEAGYNVVDSQVEPTSHYMHTPDDVIENTSPEFATAVAAVNVVAAAAVAGVVGQDPNLPPETTLIANCAATQDVVTPNPIFEWKSVDFDGTVAAHEYSVAPPGAPDAWVAVPGEQTSVSFSKLAPGHHVFKVRAVDGEGLVDASPETCYFAVCDTCAPILTVDTNFLPAPLSFSGLGRPAAGKRPPRGVTGAPPTGGAGRQRGRDSDPRTAIRHGQHLARDAQPVYENELLAFRVSSDASGYCGRADSVAVAIGDTSAWSPWRASPYGFTLRPALSDTAVRFRARDDAGTLTTGSLRLSPVEAPMDLPLLRVDDWSGGGVSETEHDGFYESLLAGHEWVEWDPLDHVEGGHPTLPSMEELGRYRTVLWSVGPGFGFLRSAQAESAYHYLEGYVRAGGNLVLEGQSSLTSLLGTDAQHYDPDRPLPEFVVEHVGVDSMRNAGSSSNVAYPATYGWAFLGGIAVPGSPFSDVPVDTLGKWSPEYIYYGGVPRCEVTRPLPATRRVFLFDSYWNPTLRELPCATIAYATDGTGTFAHFGFPFYYLKDAPARTMMTKVLELLEEWQAPAELVFIDADPSPRSVTLTWYLDPPEAPAGCHVERAEVMAREPGAFVPARGGSAAVPARKRRAAVHARESGAGGVAERPRPEREYERVNDDLITAGDGGRFSFTDTAVVPGATYSYRLRVVEQWGGETLHGPWTVATAEEIPDSALSPPVPNPASRSVGIHYVVGRDHCWVEIAIYDCAGRLVRRIRTGSADAGEYTAVWDGRDDAGRAVGSGVYFVRARMGQGSFHRKTVLLR